MKSKTARDAKGAFAPSQAMRESDGVESAKPTVVTGSEDATVNKAPPGGKKIKDWDINYDPANMNEGETR